MPSSAALRPVGPPEQHDAFQGFADALPIGIIWFDHLGEVQAQNQLVTDLLDSPAGAALHTALHSALEEVKVRTVCVHATVDLSPVERVVITVAPERDGRGWIASFDRRRVERIKAEAGVLRAVIRAMASSKSKREAIDKAIEVVREQLPSSRIVCFEASGTELRCEGAGGLSVEERSATTPLENTACALHCAWTQQRPLHLAHLGRSTLTLPFFCEEDASVLILPTGARAQRGLLCVTAPPGLLSEGAIRIIQGLADAIGAVTDVAVIEAAAARAIEVATQADRLATIGQLVAGVAHEINNPLAFLKSNLHSLRSEVADLRGAPSGLPPAASELDEIISESIEGVSRIETIVQALKGTARRRDEKIRFDPSRAIQEAMTIFKGAKKSECEVVSAIPSLPEVIGSPSALGQVILNLLQNGLDAMSAIERRRRKLEVSACSLPEGRLKVTVRDSGCGIPPDVQKHMWEAFFTTKGVGKGTGLGLSICKEIVEEMGGWIEFETGTEGTSFHLMLPEAPE